MKRAVLMFALLSSLIGWTEESAEPKREKERTQCWAMTQSGNRCKRRAAAGRRYCHQHAADVKPKKEQERCRSMTEDGKQCEAKPVKGKCYCEKHLGGGDTGDRRAGGDRPRQAPEKRAFAAPHCFFRRVVPWGDPMADERGWTADAYHRNILQDLLGLVVVR